MNQRFIAGAAASAAVLAVWAGVQASNKDTPSYCGEAEPPTVVHPAEDSAIYEWPAGCVVSHPDILCDALNDMTPNVAIIQGGHMLARCFG